VLSRRQQRLPRSEQLHQHAIISRSVFSCFHVAAIERREAALADLDDGRFWQCRACCVDDLGIVGIDVNGHQPAKRTHHAEAETGMRAH